VTWIYAPTWYSIAFKKHVNLKRLFAMKSHDHHVMVQQILPLVVCNLLQLGPKVTIIWLGSAFGKICAKVINLNGLSNLWTYVVESLCLLEIWFPPTLFDLMTHLVIHLVDELEICGPMGATQGWCIVGCTNLGVTQINYALWLPLQWPCCFIGLKIY
jgi:hypothetical protein